MIYYLSSVHDAAKIQKGQTLEEMDEIPGRIPNVNSIAPNKEMHELLHQQILKNTVIDVFFLLLNSFR